MPHLSSTAFALQTAMDSTVPSGHHPSPGQLRSILQESTAAVMSGHANYHQNSAFCRNTQKLPLDKLVDFIFSMQSTNLPIQLASYAGFCEENQFANSALSEARSKLRSDFFKDIFEQVMSRLLLTGAFEDRKYLYPTYAIDGSTLHLEPFNKDSDDFLRTKSPKRKRAGAHVVAAYDVDNKLFTDVEIQKLAKKNERIGALERMRRIAEKGIFIMDRGFHGFSFEKAIMDLVQLFLIRLKKRDYQALLQIAEEYDIDPEVDITKNLILVKKNLAKYKGDALHYPLRGKDKSCLDANGECNFTIRKKTRRAMLRVFFGLHGFPNRVRPVSKTKTQAVIRYTE